VPDCDLDFLADPFCKEKLRHSMPSGRPEASADNFS
jgi:hypothetical protein